MAKHLHAIRDAVHVFTRLHSDERKALDSRPFQRLRHIHQLALTHLIYPGATHKRFEHSLGVMELAERAFRIITAPENVDERVRNIVPHEKRADNTGVEFFGWPRCATTLGIFHSPTLRKRDCYPSARLTKT